MKSVRFLLTMLLFTSALAQTQYTTQFKLVTTHPLQDIAAAVQAFLHDIGATGRNVTVTPVV